jgi:hypothetical protein
VRVCVRERSGIEIRVREIKPKHDENTRQPHTGKPPPKLKPTSSAPGIHVPQVLRNAVLVRLDARPVLEFYECRDNLNRNENKIIKGNSIQFD